MKYLIIIGVISLFLIPNHLVAQTAFVSVGGDIISERGSVSYSIGQIVYKTVEGTQAAIHQGVQQPYDILVITSSDDFTQIDFECIAFPNPTNDLLTLRIKNKHPFGLSYQLVNSTGRIIDENELFGKQTTLSLKNYTPAIYFLRVMDNERIVRIFKIIKH